ncbi:MAG: 2-oxoacid:acceptor oxidoreductase family protein [Candidatus Bathyarchaeota archaeon]|nr:MAG: 2-oxoacid:acceptor oxidoreductase family protein [Candidatus Bathyarchaeota archaeon]
MRAMYEIRWNGRAGQGIITVSRLLGYAAILEGKYAQAFPQFGPERIGAPIVGYTRISDEPIEIHSAVYKPDAVVVLDDTVPRIVKVTDGLKRNGKLLINSIRNPRELKKELDVKDAKCYSVDATQISLDILGNSRAINTAMLGALVKSESLVSIDALNRVLKKRFGKTIAEKNIAVLLQAYKEVIEV